MGTSITFHGATDTVTGSRHLLQTNGQSILVDCGLFQGPSEVRRRNWEPFPVPVDGLDAIVLTHAHIDHTGYLPRLVKQGYRGPIYCTPATRDLLAIMLRDSARLQEEESAHANRHKWSKHDPALPLYDQEDVEECVRLLRGVSYGESFQPSAEVRFHYQRAGHILGSAFAFAETAAGTILFSGDLGRYGQVIIPDPSPVSRADYLLVESTYGNRDHRQVDVLAELQRIIRRACEVGGFILIPSFAIGRTQELLYLLRTLRADGRIPVIPTFVDSPMAVSAVPLFLEHREEHDLEMEALLNAEESPFGGSQIHFVNSREQSKALNELTGPGIIIAGSGMANGGRIRHHLLNRVSDARTTLLFVGYQGQGTPGRALLDGATTFRAYGWEVPVRARIECLDALSAHADRTEIMQWLELFEEAPKTTFLVHGEPDARAALAARIADTLGWRVYQPALHEEISLRER